MILIILPYMSTLTDLIDKIDNPELKARISQEVNRLTKQKKFGLVFEEHLPECSPLYDLKVKKGSTVAMRVVEGPNGKLAIGSLNDTYTVLSVDGDKAVCEHNSDKEQVAITLDNLVCVAKFGDPIYPYLKQLDAIKNAPDSKLWHTLIEADNYHALQLLVYLYGGMVDCIYIDPPYNTGDRSWKYNNDYVDSSDEYRHSKWLSMMKRRLLLAKQLLNPKDSVLVVTIDEKEYLHLGCLLEELFPEARIQMVSVAIHSSGVARSEFSRTDEYYFFVFMGNASPTAVTLDGVWNDGDVKRQDSVRWESLLRSGNNGRRIDRPNLFYPVLFNPDTESLVGFGDPVPLDVTGKDYKAPKGTIAVLPYASDGSEACWRISASKAKELIQQGAFDWGAFKGKDTALKYLKPGELEKIQRGDYQVIGHKENGAMIISSDNYRPKWVPGTQWHVSSHQAGGSGGSMLIKTILGTKRFDFPKSLYAVKDTIRFLTAEKKDALVVDFFSGSGTTLHAVNLLNAEDGGNRRCIMVTNNEISAEEISDFIKKGFKPGDDEWDAKGIARYVTWPRTTCSIKGVDVNGKPLEGKYIDTDINMSDGFKANAVFYHLGFLDKNSVALGRQLKELLPLLWLKAGAVGECPKLPMNQPLPPMMIQPENKFAVLIDEIQYNDFMTEVNRCGDVETVYIVTDSDAGYREMAGKLKAKNTYQLYRDYLDNFRINRAAR